MSSAQTVAQLIDFAKANPTQPIVKGLLYVGNIMLIHAPEESFKTMFVTQLAANIAAREPFVRHDHKPKAEDQMSGNTNDRIRGSSEWKEDPETILFLDRRDRRVGKIVLEVGKLRYGVKPPPIELWFDQRSFRLDPLPPVIS